MLNELIIKCIQNFYEDIHLLTDDKKLYSAKYPVTDTENYDLENVFRDSDILYYSNIQKNSGFHKNLKSTVFLYNPITLCYIVTIYLIS